MTVGVAFLLVCLVVKVTHAEDEIQNGVACLCGGENVTIYGDVNDEVCTKLSKCKKCEEGSDVCSECPEGFKGPFCTEDNSKNCKYPSPITNGNFQISHPIASIGQETKLVPVDTVLEYSCNEGYRLTQRKYFTCRTCDSCSNAWWSPRDQTPQCKTDCGRGLYNYGPCRLLYCNRHTPWVVSISVKYDNVVTHVCLGTLLNHQTVLTAAHCLVGHSTFLIQFGKHGSRYRDDDLRVMARRSSQFLLHPDFSNTTFDSNIGLLFFEPKIRFTADVRPICIQESSNINKATEVGKTGIMSVTNGIDDAFRTGRMELVRMTVLSAESCLEANKQAGLFITGNSFCAGNKNDYQSVCDGDDGAPLFYYDRRENRFMLQGIASFRTRGFCNSIKGNYAIFTKLDNFLNWINENLK